MAPLHYRMPLIVPRESYGRWLSHGARTPELLKLIETDASIPHVEHEYVVGNIIAVKDEAEGLPGRLIYETPVRPERPKWKRRKPS